MYTIGIDFGTLSARAVLADVMTGDIAATSVYPYPHGVISGCLPTGEPLPDSYALQHPSDWAEALEAVVREVVSASPVPASQIAGIGLDFTASTVLPVDGNGTPLCLLKEFSREPHAWPKLWKHHGAQPYADEITRDYPELLPYYGGRANAEWGLPKLLETKRESSRVFAAACRFIEAGDYMTYLLTGRETRAVCSAGFKYFYSRETGYPRVPLFDGIAEKLGPSPLPQDACAGRLTEEFAAKTGLLPGIAVAAAHVDAHAGIPAARCLSAGQLLMNIGTSSCHMLLDDRRLPVMGISGSVPDGAFPGTVCYEAGQTAVGDAFEMTVKTMNAGTHAELTEAASRERPGESGLVALDWLGGNRSILANANLTGLIVGLTAQTKPHEIYRAVLESTAFGARKIVEAFRGAGLNPREAIAAGGISRKNALLVEIYADVLNMPVSVAEAEYGAALGSAIFASAACGLAKSVSEAALRMTKPHVRTVLPNKQNAAVYDRLYGIYSRLHDDFAYNGIMEALRSVKNS